MSDLEIQAYSVAKFCEVYHVGKTLAYAEMKAGRLRSVKCGKRRLIPAEAAREWLASLEETA